MCLYQKNCHFEIAFWADYFFVYLTMPTPWASITKKMIFELGKCFPFQELMDAFGMAYPQYWLVLNLETSF